jgi:hypothetical protein
VKLEAAGINPVETYIRAGTMHAFHNRRTRRHGRRAS